MLGIILKDNILMTPKLIRITLLSVLLTSVY